MKRDKLLVISMTAEEKGSMKKLALAAQRSMADYCRLILLAQVPKQAAIREALAQVVKKAL